LHPIADDVAAPRFAGHTVRGAIMSDIRREDWLPPFDVARHYRRDREGKGRSEP